MNGEWYINLDGKPQGTFTADQVQSFIQSGKITKGCLIWKKGFAAWEPVELHFKFDEPKEVIKSIQQPINREIATETKPQNFTLLLLVGLVTIASIAGFFWIKSSSETAQDTSSLTFNWFAALALSILCAGVFISLLWRHSNFLWSDSTRQARGGLLKLFCFFGSISLVVYSGIFGYAGLTLIQISKARSSYNKYTIEVDPASNVLTISGLIGPDLARKVIDKLTVHSDVEAILIDSPGGLIDEGLSAARYIETLANSTVIANGTCNSSCLLVLMSGKNRLANWNMKLGFHAASAITNLGDSSEALIAGLGDESYSYLVKRGVPYKIIQQAKTQGASKMVPVSAIDLFDNGALTGLIDGDELIDADNAKWRYLEEIFGGTEFSNLSSVLSAIREGDQSLVKKYAAPFYNAIKADDGAKTKILMAEVIGSITARALKAAEGSALNTYVGVQYFQMRHLAKLEQWKACVEYSDGNLTAETQSVLSKELRQKEFGALAALIRSASSNKWKAQPIPSWVEKTATSVYKEVVPKALELGLIDDEAKPKSLRGQCIYYYMLFDKFLDLDGDTAAPVLRSILTQ